MLVSLTPRDVINSKAMFTFSAFWTLMRGFLLYRPREIPPIQRRIISLRCLSHNTMATIPMISWTSQRKKIKIRSVEDWLLTISWIRRTPSERSLTRFDIGGMSLASSLVFSLQKRSAVCYALPYIQATHHLQNVRSWVSRDLASGVSMFMR